MKRLLFALTIACIPISACAPSSESIAIEKPTNDGEARIAKCNSVRDQAKSMEEASGQFARQARANQLNWITAEVKKLYEDGKITVDDWTLFSSSTSKSTTLFKLPGGELDLLMKKIVESGWIKPYLPKDVVELGEKAAMSPSGASYQVNYPECFSDLEFSRIQLLAKLKPSKGVWAERIENPVDLIPY